MDDVEELEAKVRDSCTAVTSYLMGLLKVRMSEVGLEGFDAKAEKARLCTLLNKEYAQSIFGTTITKSTVRSRLSNCSSQQHSITTKRVVCCTFGKES